MAAPTGAAFITAPTWDAGTSLFASVDDEGASAGASGTNESSQSTLLLKKRREMGEVEEQLAKLQAETTIKMAQCDERERILVKNQKKESDHVERCHKYIDENDRKRERAEMKERAEAKRIEMFASTQAQLEAHLQRLNAERGQLETWLTKLSKNREYLENIVAQCDDYEEISDILSRHRVLHDTHMDLQREVEESTLRLEKLRHEFGTMMQEQQNLLLVNNNKLAHMQKELDAIKREADTAESLRLGDETLRKQKITELGQVRNAIQHMYTRCESSRSGKAGAAAAKATKAAAEDEGEDAGEEEAQLASKLKNIQSRIMTLRSIVSGYDQWKEDGSLDGVIFET